MAVCINRLCLIGVANGCIEFDLIDIYNELECLISGHWRGSADWPAHEKAQRNQRHAQPRR